MEGKDKVSDESDSRQRSSRYPRHTLEKVEVFGRHAFNAGARNLDIDQVAQAAGYKNSENGAFRALRSSAFMFGLIKSVGNGYISLTDHWIYAFNEDDLGKLKYARQLAMLQPQLYRQLFDDYNNRQLPRQDKLTRDLYLNPKYGILKDAAPVAAQNFLEAADYSGLIDSQGFLRQPTENLDASDADTNRLVDSQISSKNEASFESVEAQTGKMNPNPTTFLPEAGNLDRIEIKLMNGSRAYLFIPVPLPFGEKERLKKYIDLMLEEPAPSKKSQDRSYGDDEDYENEP